MIDPQLTDAQRRAFEFRYSVEKAAEAFAAFTLAWEEATRQELLRLHQGRIEAKKKAEAEDLLYREWRAQKDQSGQPATGGLAG